MFRKLWEKMKTGWTRGAYAGKGTPGRIAAYSSGAAGGGPATGTSFSGVLAEEGTPTRGMRLVNSLGPGAGAVFA